MQKVKSPARRSSPAASLVLVAAVSLGSPAARADKAAPAAAVAEASLLVPFSSPESARRLERSQHKRDFFDLVNQFESQQNLPGCGPTSAVIVLNALRADNDGFKKPLDLSLFPAEFLAGIPKGMSPVFPRYTQNTFLDENVQKVKPRARFFGAPDEKGKRDGGLQLRQLRDVLGAYGVDAQLRVADDKLDDDTIRRELKENLARAGDFVIVNYFRPALGQPGGGHISPLGAYDAESDSFLILDVNPNRARFAWVPAALLIKAMRTHDSDENRGYLLISEGKK